MSVRAPVRIDFGGGWTDVPPYPERDGGYVCNVAITRHAHVRVRPREGAVGGVAGAGDALAAAALRRAGVAADVSIANDFPVGAGLGGSSAAGIALQAAFCGLRGEVCDAETLVVRSRAVEVEALGIAGGWQDHYASAYGGALGIEFGARTAVKRIALTSSLVGVLARRCLLVYTGETRISSANITAVLDAYAAQNHTVTRALGRMATLAREMTDSLGVGDVDRLGQLVGEHWTHQRSLHPAITTSRIDAIVERAAAAGAAGAKALGASGGGCVLVVTGDDPAPVRSAIAGLGTVLPWTVDATGVTEDVHDTDTTRATDDTR